MTRAEHLQARAPRERRGHGEKLYVGTGHEHLTGTAEHLTADGRGIASLTKNLWEYPEENGGGPKMDV